MINAADITSILSGYDQSKLRIGTLGGHSALDILIWGPKKKASKPLSSLRKETEQKPMRNTIRPETAKVA